MRGPLASNSSRRSRGGVNTWVLKIGIDGIDDNNVREAVLLIH